MINFTDLRAQIEDGLILEDELELAKLAAVVPNLVISICNIIEACRKAEVVLQDTIKVLSEVQGGFDENNGLGSSVLTDMYPKEEEGELKQKSKLNED